MDISIAIDTPGLQTKGNAELLLQSGPQQILTANKHRPTAEELICENVQHTRKESTTSKSQPTQEKQD